MSTWCAERVFFQTWNWEWSMSNSGFFFVRFFKTQGEKNSSPEKTQKRFWCKNSTYRSFFHQFPLKTQPNRAILPIWVENSTGRSLIWYQSTFSSCNKTLIEPCFWQLTSLKATFFSWTQGLFSKLNDIFLKLKEFCQNSTILKKKLKEFASKLKLPELLSTIDHWKIAQKSLF